jgi:putative addiction module killer protein
VLETLKTERFQSWFLSLKDEDAKAKIAQRLLLLAEGNPGDVAPVSKGLSELRIHHGAGYRLYFMRHGKAVIILLCGGNKKTQRRDIEEAHVLAGIVKESNI